MTHQDIIAHLCLKYPPEVIHSITTENIISAIARRMGEEALELSAEDLELAKAEVSAAIDHYDPSNSLLRCRKGRTLQ
jgi:hypothetical protein